MDCLISRGLEENCSLMANEKRNQKIGNVCSLFLVGCKVNSGKILRKLSSFETGLTEINKIAASDKVSLFSCNGHIVFGRNVQCFDTITFNRLIFL